MSQSREPSRTSPPAPPRRQSVSTADGLVAQRLAVAERERQTAQARRAARRLVQAADPRP